MQLSGYNVQAGEEALRRVLAVLAHPGRPTAALCINDLVAGVLRAARPAGLSVPVDTDSGHSVIFRKSAER